MTRKFRTFSENLSLFGEKMKHAIALQIINEKIKCRKYYNAVYLGKLIEQVIDMPSALIVNCAL